ncbi:MAG TPA: RDD family protein [Terriglobales bacterium]|nr:RDD family protein [Terriglobales bacterium]
MRDRVEAAPDPDPVVTPEFRTAELVCQPAPATRARETTAKIIEFPRGSYAPPVPLSELAEPVIDRPRILEAPEVVPPPPALGGITIEQEQKKDPERRPGIDMPLESAPFERRLLAVAIDVLIVLLASGLFGAICAQMAGARPKVPQRLGLAVGLLSFFWVAYQYLLVVYSGTTPGLRAMKLRLQRFDGSATNRRLRQGRVLGSVLSGISLGMGYAWQFLDEDSLCWHERVTKTYLAPQNGDAKKRSDQSKL